MKIVNRESADINLAAQELEFACWSSVGFLYAGQIHSIYDAKINENLNLQLGALDDRKQLIACLTCVPLSQEVNGQGGWDWALQNAVPLSQANSLCGMSMSVSPLFRGKGISELLIKSLKEEAVKHNIEKLVFPVRPVLKSHHLSWSMTDYLALNKDPWVKSHLKIGGVQGEICERSVVIEKSIGFWESWLGKQWGDLIIVPGALSPIKVLGSQGIYEEPNVWITHGVK